MKRFCFAVLAFLIGLIGVLLINEIFFRIFRGSPNKSKHHLANVVQQDTRYLFTPNTSRHNTTSFNEFNHDTHINQFGYRGKDFEFEKPPGRLRIFAVGDSFTHGVGSEDDETIPALIEKKLRDQNLDVEVINAGVGNTSTILHYVNIRDIHLQYKPDLVLLFFDFTDLWDDWSAERHAIFNTEGEIIRFDPEYFYGKRDWWITLTNKSAFCRYLHKKLVRTYRKIKLLGFWTYVNAKIHGKRAKAVIANLETTESAEAQMEHDGLLLLRGREKKLLIDQHWPRTTKYLTKIRQLLAGQDIPVILIMYPHGIHVGVDQWDKGRVLWGFERNKKYTDTYPFELVESFAGEANVPFINTLDSFLRAPAQKYFFEHDGHMTPAANEIVAETVSQNKVFQNLLSQLRI